MERRIIEKGSLRTKKKEKKERGELPISETSKRRGEGGLSKISRASLTLVLGEIERDVRLRVISNGEIERKILNILSLRETPMKEKGRRKL